MISKVNMVNKGYKEFGINNEQFENWLAELSEERRKIEAGKQPEKLWLLQFTITLDMPALERKLAEIQMKKVEEKKQRNIELGKLKARLKEINYYLRRKRFDAAAKEDPILILQKLGVISPTGFDLSPTKGSWEFNWLSGKLEYKPPTRNFADKFGKMYSYHDIQTWVNWQTIYPLLQIAYEQLQAEFKRLENKT